MVGTRKSNSGSAQTGPNRTLGRRVIGTAAAIALGVASLSGCAAGMDTQTADQVPNHDGAFARLGPISVSNGTFGNGANDTGAVAYQSGSAVPLTMWVANTAIADDTITKISTSAGQVTLAGDAVVPAQGLLEIGGDGVKAQIDSATQDIRYGFPVTVDVYFAHAGKLTFEVPVAHPDERDAGRDGTSIYHGDEPNLWQESNGHNG